MGRSDKSKNVAGGARARNQVAGNMHNVATTKTTATVESVKPTESVKSGRKWVRLNSDTGAASTTFLGELVQETVGNISQYKTATSETTADYRELHGTGQSAREDWRMSTRRRCQHQIAQNSEGAVGSRKVGDT